MTISSLVVCIETAQMFLLFSVSDHHVMLAFSSGRNDHLRTKDSLKRLFGYKCYTYTPPAKGKVKAKTLDCCNRTTAAGGIIIKIQFI